MTPELEAVAASQGGVFLRRQAVACGYSDKVIRRLLRTHTWVRVRYGAYATADLFDSLDEHGRAELVIRAVALVLDDPAVFSHGSAAVLHGLPTFDIDLDLVHVTRPSHHSGRRVAGISHHEAGIAARDIQVVRSLEVTGLERTAVDIAREYSLQAGVVSADAALRLGADRGRMLELGERMCRWAGASNVMPVVRFADPGAETPGESLARLFVVSLGFPMPETQVEIRDGSFVARCDMRLRGTRILIEFDGRLKYRRTRDDCDPVIDDGDIVWAEKQREDRLRALDHPMFRLVWSDLFGAARRRAAERLLGFTAQYGVVPVLQPTG